MVSSHSSQSFPFSDSTSVHMHTSAKLRRRTPGALYSPQRLYIRILFLVRSCTSFSLLQRKPKEAKPCSSSFGIIAPEKRPSGLKDSQHKEYVRVSFEFWKPCHFRGSDGELLLRPLICPHTPLPLCRLPSTPEAVLLRRSDTADA